MDLQALNKKLPQVANVRKFKASRIFTIEQMDLTFSNGQRAQYERIVGGRGAVMAVPFDGSHFLLSVEYAGGLMRYELGLVKGKIDEGEAPEKAVLRELEEEIGFGARKAELLKDELTVAPGMLQLKMYVYLCTDLYPKRLTGDEPEPIDLVKVTPKEALDLIFDPHSPLKEARAALALTLALHRLGMLPEA